MIWENGGLEMLKEKNAVLLDGNQLHLFILSGDRSGFRAQYYIEIIFYFYLSSPAYI